MQKATNGRKESARVRQIEAFGQRALRPQMRQRANQMEIAQAAGTFLDVGLAVVQRVLIFGVAEACVLNQVLAQLCAVFFQKRRPFGGKSGMQGGVTGKIAQIQEIDGEIDVLLVKLQALRKSAHGVIQPDSGIPQQSDAFRQRLAKRNPGRLAFEQNQNVDCGIGKRFAAPISARS